MVRILRCVDDLSELSILTRKGALIVYPTDTVYGLGCDPTSPVALKRCFAVKQRSDEKLLPVLFVSKNVASSVVDFGPLSNLLAKKFWPGKLTMVLPLRMGITLPFELTRGQGKLAVRVPGSDCTLKVLSACGGFLVGTSANISGSPPTSDSNSSQLLDFAELCDVFVKSELTAVSTVPSTVIELGPKEDRFTVIRDGAIPVRSIEDYVKLSRAESS